MSKYATRKELKSWGAVIPGYPIGRGEALVKTSSREVVLHNAEDAGFKMTPLVGVGHDYNFGGDLYKFVRVETHA